MHQILVERKFAVEILDRSYTWDRADPWWALLPRALVPQRCVPPSQGKGSVLGTIAPVKCHPKERDKESYKKEGQDGLMMMMM